MPIPASPDEDGDPAAWRRRVVGGDECGQLRVAPDHRQAGRSRGQGQRRPRCAAGHGRRRRLRDRQAWLGAGSSNLGVPDRLVQVRRLRQRRDAELALEDGDPGPVLADGAGPIAGPREQGHQLAPSRFVERIEVEPARGSRDRAGQVPGGLGGRRQPLEHVPDQSLDGDRPRRTPIVEVRAVAEREPGQERTARERRGPAQARVVARRGGGLELREVDVDPVAVEGHGRAVRR